jgi:threonine dehydrogenase-like Zn-dependent dehydrogenase
MTDINLPPLKEGYSMTRALSDLKIAVAGTGYVGLSNAILLAQNTHVTAVDIIQSKVDMINARKSPIIDQEIEEYLANKSESGCDDGRRVRLQGCGYRRHIDADEL